MKTGIVCLIIVIVTVYFFIKRRNSDRSKIIAEKTPNNQKSDPKKEAPAKPKVNRTDVYNEVKA